MTVLRMADAPTVGLWDAYAWARMGARWAFGRADGIVEELDGAGRYTPEQVARVVFGRWPR